MISWALIISKINLCGLKVRTEYSCNLKLWLIYFFTIIILIMQKKFALTGSMSF